MGCLVDFYVSLLINVLDENVVQNPQLFHRTHAMVLIMQKSNYIDSLVAPLRSAFSQKK
jgi:hypothetical protein